MTDHLGALRRAMGEAGMDAVLLSAPAWSAAIVGHRRVAVHGPSGPLPTAVITAAGPPTVLTPDPDGAPLVPSETLHGIAWDPRTLTDAIRATLGPLASGTVGLDVVSPGSLALLAAALPGASLVDANAVLTEALLPKDDAEIEALAAACALSHRAALAGRSGGMLRAVEVLAGAFPIADLVFDERRCIVEVSAGGFAGVARLGPADPGVLTEAVGVLVSGLGSPVGVVAPRLPAGVTVCGLGRGHEPPSLGAGRASPPGVVLAPGAVLLVCSGSAAVTVALTSGEPRWLSPMPAEVAR